jgi:thiamine-phosphate pyrophosphorylase
VGLGPVFGTMTKQVPAPVLGLGGFGAVVRESPLPVVGIGGVKLENIAHLAATGAHGGAVASDALLAEDIAEQVRCLAAAFDRGARGASLGSRDE